VRVKSEEWRLDSCYKQCLETGAVEFVFFVSFSITIIWEKIIL
jgi:hypothetical protein